MSYALDEEFETAKDFIDFFINDSRFSTRSKFDAVSTGKNGYIFRGQSNSEWPLLASAFRDGGLENYTVQPPGINKVARDGSFVFDLGWHLNAEVKAVYLFLENADSLGIPTPLDYSKIKVDMDLIISALNQSADVNYDFVFPSESLNRAFALAQHSGVPTRLLDWSESPLVACYFAAYSASSFSNTKNVSGQEISVIYTGANIYGEKKSPISIIKAPRFENTFSKQQQGLFTNIKEANAYFLQHGRWPSVDDVTNLKFQLHRARLPATQADEVLRRLFDLGISRHSLMPSLENAAIAYQYIKTLFDIKQ